MSLVMTQSPGAKVLQRHSAETLELRKKLAHSKTEVHDLQLSLAALRPGPGTAGTQQHQHAEA